MPERPKQDPVALCIDVGTDKGRPAPPGTRGCRRRAKWKPQYSVVPSIAIRVSWSRADPSWAWNGRTDTGRKGLDHSTWLHRIDMLKLRSCCCNMVRKRNRKATVSYYTKPTYCTFTHGFLISKIFLRLMPRLRFSRWHYCAQFCDFARWSCDM